MNTDNRAEMTGTTSTTPEPAEVSAYRVWEGPADSIQAQTHTSGVNYQPLPAYWTYPFRQDHSNGCAQAVMASMLVYWGKLKPAPDLAYQFANNSNTCPNVVGGLFGTNWERVRDVFLSYGLNVRGFNNPDNQKIEPQTLINMLASYTSNGRPFAVILGNGELNPGEMGAHWWIVCHIDQNSVWLANGGNDILSFPTAQFLDAWRADGLPWTHHAGVVVY